MIITMLGRGSDAPTRFAATQPTKAIEISVKLKGLKINTLS
jgi:hypothetical protein